MANQFKQSPIDVLKANDFDYVLWSAAFDVIMQDKKDQAEAQKAAARKK